MEPPLKPWTGNDGLEGGSRATHSTYKGVRLKGEKVGHRSRPARNPTQRPPPIPSLLPADHPSCWIPTANILFAIFWLAPSSCRYGRRR